MELLELSYFRKEFKFTVNKNSSFGAYDMFKNRVTMDFDVFLPSKGINLQRELCWTLNQKQEFIISILKGISIPKISIINHSINDNRDKVCMVIDGKQRLTTYLSFLKNEFCLPTGHYFKNLNGQCQHELTRFWFSADVAFSYYDEPISDEDKITWFEQINFTGTPQDAEHLTKLKS